MTKRSSVSQEEQAESTHPIVQHVINFFNDEIIASNINCHTVYIGQSGGMDSAAMSHILSVLVEKKLVKQVIALHVNHHIADNCDEWVQVAQSYSKQLGFSFKLLNIHIPSKRNLEETARMARYDALYNYVPKGSILFTGHHESDQAETILLQLFRGAGVKGLASMPALAKRRGVYLARPLLDVAHSDLIKYAEQSEVDFIMDDSNHDKNYYRNHVRHDLIPSLEMREPSIESNLARSAGLCAKTHQAETEMGQLLLNQSNNTEHVSIDWLATFKRPTQQSLLRTFLSQFDLLMPSERKLLTILHQMHTARPDRQPEFIIDGYFLRRFHKTIYLREIKEAYKKAQTFAVNWNLLQPLETPTGTLIAKTADVGLNITKINPKKINVKYRQGGERMHPVGRIGSHPLKKLFQEAKVPPWDRGVIPLVFHEKELIAVPGYWIAEGWQAPKGIALSFKVK